MKMAPLLELILTTSCVATSASMTFATINLSLILIYVHMRFFNCNKLPHFKLKIIEKNAKNLEVYNSPGYQTLRP